MKPAALLGLLLAVAFAALAPLAAAKPDAETPTPYKREAHFGRRWKRDIQPERPATVLRPAPLLYPKKWRTWGQPAYAVVEFLVLDTGRTEEVQCTEATDQAFAKAAEWTIENTLYTPALKNQQGVTSKVVQRFEFALKQPEAPKPAEAAAEAKPAEATKH
ncbi:MAG: energy transducer TonB [Opitutaceae bacterium]